MRAITVAVARRYARCVLKYTGRIPWNVPQGRTFALAVDVGQGRAGTKAEPPSPSSYARSPEQYRAALAEHERMVRATQRILGLETLTPGSVQELRVVLHYWTGSRPHGIGLPKSEKNKTLRQAESLLEWILSSNMDQEALYNIIRTDECVSGAIVNLTEQYLMPFRGTHQSLKTLSDRRLRSFQNVEELKTALVNATKIMDRLQSLFDDLSYPRMVPDKFACNMMLNLWVKRCWFLAQHGNSLDDDFVQTALKGVKTVEECLEAMKECISSLPSPDPSSTAALHMSAWVNSGLPNRAEKAEEILREAEENPSGSLKTVPYNALMHAYASCVQYDKENATRAGNLLKHMWSREIECDVTTYSSLLLAVSNAGDPDRAVDILMQMEKEAEKTQIFPNAICYNIGTFTVSEECDPFTWRGVVHSNIGALPSSDFSGEMPYKGISNESRCAFAANGTDE